MGTLVFQILNSTLLCIQYTDYQLWRSKTIINKLSLPKSAPGTRNMMIKAGA